MRNMLLLMVYGLLVCCDIPSRETEDFLFLQIDELRFQGKESGFTDAWISLDGQSAGVYELPRRIPIAASMSNDITIQAGIRENGIQSTPRIYPFTSLESFKLAASEGEVEEILPDFSFVPGTMIRLDADFQNSNEFGFDEDGNTATRIEIENGIGVMRIPSDSTMEEASKLIYNNIPKNGSPVFLEIEYRGNRDLDVGLIGITGSEVFKEYFVSLRSESEWKKAFINFTDLIIASNLDGYQVLLGCDNLGGGEEAEIYIDNIKLLHF